jgi:hypothetical protein
MSNLIELFCCPVHGIPAIIVRFVGGVDLQILCLTARIYYARLKSLIGGVYGNFD